MGPHRYLVRARVARVRTLLISGDRSLAAIADETGFSDQSKVFKKFTGMSPKTFRANRTAPRCPVQAWFQSMQENSPVQ